MGDVSQCPYPYTHQLLRLEQAGNSHRDSSLLKDAAIVTPVCQKFWKDKLATHHDPDFVGWVLRGLQEGFRLGFDDTKVNLSSAHSNMNSANQHPELVSQYIQKEVLAGHLLRINPSEGALHCRIHTSPLGVIPKRGRLDQWRLIMDLSSPHGHSVNDGISVELCSLHYALVDSARETWSRGTACKNGYTASIP